MIGSKLGPYELLEEVGRGGMAAVYRAYQPNIDRFVAVKVIYRSIVGDNKALERFQREARLVAKLEHPHILPVYDYNGLNEPPYIVMRYMPTGTLKDVLERERLPFHEVAYLLTQIASALDYAHRQGVIHRDIKPSNIMVDGEGNAFLTDFGIARDETAPNLTGTGSTLGTPGYMAPEQGMGNPIDGRADIYALGVMLYEMLSGEMPYTAATPMAVILKHINSPLPEITQVNANLPPAVSTVIQKAMAKKPEDRYATATDMARALSAALGPSEDSAPVRLQAAAARTIQELAAGRVQQAKTWAEQASHATPASSGTPPNVAAATPHATGTQPTGTASVAQGAVLGAGAVILLLALVALGAFATVTIIGNNNSQATNAALTVVAAAVTSTADGNATNTLVASATLAAANNLNSTGTAAFVLIAASTQKAVTDAAHTTPTTQAPSLTPIPPTAARPTDKPTQTNTPVPLPSLTFTTVPPSPTTYPTDKPTNTLRPSLTFSAVPPTATTRPTATTHPTDKPTLTNTLLPPTFTFTPIPPTATTRPTNTPVLSSTTASFTPIPPSPTSLPTHTPTFTPFPPTATLNFTFTPIPPSPTSTSTSTLTPVPPSPTATATITLPPPTPVAPTAVPTTAVPIIVATQTPIPPPTSTPLGSLPYVTDMESADTLKQWDYDATAWRLQPDSGNTSLLGFGGLTKPAVVLGRGDPEWQMPGNRNLLLSVSINLDNNASGGRVLFRYSDSGYYVMEVVPGLLKLKRAPSGKIDKGAEKELPQGTLAGAPIRSGTFYHWTIWADDNRVFVYLEHRLIMQVKDPAATLLPGGAILFQTVNPSPTYSVRFDDLKIQRPAPVSQHFEGSGWPNTWLRSNVTDAVIGDDGANNHFIEQGAGEVSPKTGTLTDFLLSCRLQSVQGGFDIHMRESGQGYYLFHFAEGNMTLSQVDNTAKAKQLQVFPNFYSRAGLQEFTAEMVGSRITIYTSKDVWSQEIKEGPLSGEMRFLVTRKDDSLRIDDFLIAETARSATETAQWAFEKIATVEARFPAQLLTEFYDNFIDKFAKKDWWEGGANAAGEPKYDNKSKDHPNYLEMTYQEGASWRIFRYVPGAFLLFGAGNDKQRFFDSSDVYVRANVRLSKPGTAWVAARTSKTVGGGGLDGYRLEITKHADNTYTVTASGVSGTGQKTVYYDGALPALADNPTPDWNALLIVTYQNKVAFFVNGRFLNAQENIEILNGTVALGVEKETTADFDDFQLRDVSPETR